MKKFLMLLVSLSTFSAFSADYTGVEEMDNVMIGNELVEVNEIKKGESYSLKMNYGGELDVDTVCKKDRVQEGLTVFSCMIDKSSNYAVEMVFWTKMGIEQRITIDLKTPNNLGIELKRVK